MVDGERLSHKERKERRKQIANVAAMDGVSAASEKFGVSTNTVHSSLREFRKTPASERPLPEKRNTSLFVVAALLDGRSALSIATDLSVTRARVYAIRQMAIEAGIRFPEAR